MNLSIIIPIYNSEKIIPILTNKIKNNLKKKIKKFEIILVNDHSIDKSWITIKKTSKRNSFIKGINLLKNFGQHNAIMAGLNHSVGKNIILMDDDMQHSPEDIFKIYQNLIKGYDACYVKYINRQHAKWKIFVSWLNNIVASILALKPIDLYTSSFKGFKKKIRSKIIKNKQNKIFIDWLILWNSKKIKTINVIHKKRYSGATNYNLRRLLKLWSIMVITVIPKNIMHRLILILPKFLIRTIILSFVNEDKKEKKQYIIAEKTFN